MISGHAQYAKGYAEETIGNVTGSKEWQESGKKDISEAISEMKAASQQNSSEPTGTGVGGKIEEMAGKVAGCEGMEKEGIVRQEKAQ